MPTPHIDQTYMQRCLDLAQLGIQQVAPNPMVGSVIVHEGKIIGEGYHRKYGEAHAERNAIDSVTDKKLLENATLYVNLEPCAHYGKTPPCASLIAQHRIPRVVIGMLDPFEQVAGKGVKMLKEAGIQVRIGVLENACFDLNRRFITFHTQKRPYIILKWAESSDGFIDAEHDAPTWLTNEEARVFVHKMRAEAAAVMVGRVAAQKDNPKLTTRSWSGRNPVRISLDRDLRLPATHHLLDGSTPSIIFTSQARASTPNCHYVTLDFRARVIEQCLDYLHKNQLSSLIVEGGEILLNSFIQASLWDEAWQFIGSAFLQSGTKSPTMHRPPENSIMLGNVKLNTYRR